MAGDTLFSDAEASDLVTDASVLAQELGAFLVGKTNGTVLVALGMLVGFRVQLAGDSAWMAADMVANISNAATRGVGVELVTRGMCA